MAFSLLHPVRVTFWMQQPGEEDFMIKAHLGGDHDRVCGVLTKDGDAWDVMTIKSGGARVGITKNGLPHDAAVQAIEDDCR
jgi:hypothetical protein